MKPVLLSKRSHEEDSDSNDTSPKRFKTDDDNKSVISSESEIEEPIESISTVISQIEPLIASFRLCAKLISKSPIQKQHYAPGNIFEFEMMDHTGKMRGKVFNEDCDVIFERLTVGKSYSIKKARLSIASPNSNMKGYEFVFHSETVIKEIVDDSLDQLEDHIETTSHSEISSLATDTIINYFGKVHLIGNIENIKKKDGTPLKLRNVELINNNKEKMTIVFWGKMALEGICGLIPGNYVLFRQVKINTYNSEKKLFYNAGSRMVTDLSARAIERMSKTDKKATSN